MYVYEHLCMYANSMCTCMPHTHASHACIHVRAYVYYGRMCIVMWTYLVGIYSYVCILWTYMYGFVFVCMYVMDVYGYMYATACVCVCMYVSLRMRACIHMSVWLCMCIRMRFIRVYEYVVVYVYTNASIHAYECVVVYVYTNAINTCICMYEFDLWVHVIEIAYMLVIILLCLILYVSCV